MSRPFGFLRINSSAPNNTSANATVKTIICSVIVSSLALRRTLHGCFCVFRKRVSSQNHPAWVTVTPAVLPVAAGELLNEDSDLAGVHRLN